MERLAEMKEYVLPKWNERFSEDISKVQAYYNRHQSEINSKFHNYIVGELISTAKDNLLFEEQRDNLFLVISYLHSGLLSRSYEYGVSLCNELFYADRNIMSVYWCPEFLYQYINDEELFLKSELQRKFIRIKKYELEELRKDLFSVYWGVAKGYFKELAANIAEQENLQIYYGEHMGELVELL